MTHPHDAPPVNPLPPVVVVLFLAIAIAESAFSLGAQGLVGGPQAVGWRLAAAEQYGFSGDIFDWMVANGRWVPEHLVRFVSYPFVHHSFTAAMFSAVILLAMGKLVGEVLGQIAVVVIFVGATVFGALMFALLLDVPGWLIGATPGVYGLIGGFSFVLWQRLADSGGQQFKAFNLIAILMGLQLVWGIFFEVGFDWVADLAGFAFGFAASFLLAPGGMARVLGGVRRD